MRVKLLRATAWDATPQLMLEMLISVAIIGMVVASIVPFVQRYVDGARLTEPLFLGRDIAYRAAIDRAFSGRWQPPAPLELPSNMRGFSVTAQGDVRISVDYDLASAKVKTMHWQHFGGSGGYGFNSWHCGGRTFASTDQPLRYSTAPAQRDVTRFLCQ